MRAILRNPQIQRLSLVIITLVWLGSTTESLAQAIWDVRGKWDIGFYVQEGSYDLPTTITNEDFATGSFSGTDNQGYAISGTVNNSSVAFNDAGYPGWALSFNGVISTNGTMAGGSGGYPGGMAYYNFHGTWGGWFWTDTGRAVPFGIPVFTVPPVSQVVKAGDPVTFSAAATGVPEPTFQWQFQNVDISNATNSSYSLSSTSIANIGLYDVVIANSAGTNVSATVSLTFLDVKLFPGLVVNGPSGASYDIQSRPAVSSGSIWTTITNIVLPSLQPFIYIDYGSLSNQTMFYRAVPH